MSNFDFDKKGKVLNEGSMGSFTEPFFDYKVMPLNHCLEQKVKKVNLSKSVYNVQIGNFVSGTEKDGKRTFSGIVQKFIRDEYNDILGVVVLSKDEGRFVELEPNSIRFDSPCPSPKVDKSKLDMGNSILLDVNGNPALGGVSESVGKNLDNISPKDLESGADSVWLLNWDDVKERVENTYDKIFPRSQSFRPVFNIRDERKEIEIFKVDFLDKGNYTNQLVLSMLDQNQLEISIRTGMSNHHSIYHIFYNKDKGFYFNKEIGRITVLFEESIPATSMNVNFFTFLFEKFFDTCYKLPHTKKGVKETIKQIIDVWNINHNDGLY